jgi:hypothetical protein
MRWVACLVLLAGCLRARATVVHQTGVEHTSGGSGSTIARVDPAREVPEGPEPIANRMSLELGALVPFKNVNETTRIHIAPGVRYFGGDHGSVLFGVAVGADYEGDHGGPGFALEGSIHAGNSSPDLQVIEQAVDLFAGVTVRSRRTQSAIAIGPSIGLLGLPGGQSVMTFGLGLRVTGARE